MLKYLPYEVAHPASGAPVNILEQSISHMVGPVSGSCKNTFHQLKVCGEDPSRMSDMRFVSNIGKSFQETGSKIGYLAALPPRVILECRLV